MKKTAIFLCVLFAMAQAIVPYKNQEFLAARISLDSLTTLLTPQHAWHPYPRYAEREAWQAFPDEIKQTAIAAGEEALAAGFPQLPATIFLEYVRNGNRTNFQNLSFGRRANLSAMVWAELFEGQGRFMDAILNGVWYICEETYWGVPAHVGAQKKGAGLPDVTEPTIDLFAAETGALLAWVDYLLGAELDQLSPFITPRIEYEIDHRLLSVYEQRDDFSWLGFAARQADGYAYSVNNWNPWINSNMLAAALLVEKDDTRRAKLVHKMMASLDNFTGPYPSDGGCDEGPNYWGRASGSLYDCLELLYMASNGKINIYAEPLVQNMGQFIYKAFINKNYVINFADANSRASIDAPLVFRYGQAIADSTMMKFAAYTAQDEKLAGISFNSAFGAVTRTLPALGVIDKINALPAAAPLLQDVWLPELQVMATRSKANSTDGFYLAAKAGHNNESHNHNDVGNFMLYYQGQPILVDAGAAEYTAKTFSSERYTLWNNQSAFHNLPTINGFQQKEGGQFHGSEVKYKAKKDKVEFSVDIAAAYEAQAGVKSWQREIILQRNKGLILQEKYKLAHADKPVQLHFMTLAEPHPQKDGVINLAASLKLYYPQNTFAVDVEKIEITDGRMRYSWGDTLYRITLTGKKTQTSGEHTISVY